MIIGSFSDYPLLNRIEAITNIVGVVIWHQWLPFLKWHPFKKKKQQRGAIPLSWEFPLGQPPSPPPLSLLFDFAFYQLDWILYYSYFLNQFGYYDLVMSSKLFDVLVLLKNCSEFDCEIGKVLYSLPL